MKTSADLTAGTSLDDPMRACESVVRALLTQASVLGLRGRPWSLAELSPTSDDHMWLKEWASRLKCDDVERYMADHRSVPVDGGAFPRNAVFGATLLWLCVEVARREAQEGSIWPALHGLFQLETEHVLFHQGQPTTEQRAALVAGARRLGLRQVFGQQGIQAWLDSIYLQFGLSFHGMTERLAYWLSGGALPAAINRLLEGANASESFRLGWDSLRQFQRGREKEADLRSKLLISPWFPLDWHDTIVESASPSHTPPRMPVGLSHSIDRGLFDGPFLRWVLGKSPEFSFAVEPDADLSASLLNVWVDSHFLGTLQRQADGRYLSMVPGPFVIQKIMASVECKLISDHGQEFIEALDLWETNEDVTIFELRHGTRLADPWTTPLDPRIPHALMVKSDLFVEPDDSPWCAIDRGEMRLHWIAPEALPNLRVLLDDDLLWEPVIARQGTKKAKPVWLDAVKLQCLVRSIKLGRTIEVGIEHPALVTVISVRLDGQTAEIDRALMTQTMARATAKTLSANLKGLPVSLRVKQGGDCFTLHTRLSIEVTGAVFGVGKTARSIDAGHAMTVDEAAQQVMRVVMPTENSGDDEELRPTREYVLMESHQRVGLLRNRAGKYPRLAGVGAPLVVCLQTFNRLGSLRAIAREVTDPGVMRDVCVSNKFVRLALRQRIEVDPEHSVICWLLDGRVLTVRPAQVRSFRTNLSTVEMQDVVKGRDVGGASLGGSSKFLNTFTLSAPELPHKVDQWHFELPPDQPIPLAIAVAFGGARIGAWWNSSPDGVDALIARSTEDPRGSAEMLRWLRWPVLNPASRGAMTLTALCSPVEFLAAWLCRRGVAGDGSLLSSSPDEGWLDAVRTIFRGWRPNEVAALALLPALSPLALTDYDGVFELLSQVDPVWVVHVLRTVIGSGELGVKIVRRLRASFLRELGQESLTESVAELLGVDTGFVENGLLARAALSVNGVSLSAHDRENAWVALGHEPYRRLLTAYLLSTVVPS